MAVDPLYNASKESLLNRVRMATADDTQTLALIDQTITEVRLGFYRKLTKERATLIAGYSLVDNPTSDQEILKAGAAYTEALWVTLLLAQRLPHLFMDNSASVGDAWNDEQLTRDTMKKEYLDALKASVDEGIAMLEAPPNENSGAVKSSSIKNDKPCMPYAEGTFKGLYPRGTNSDYFV